MLTATRSAMAAKSPPAKAQPNPSVPSGKAIKSAFKDDRTVHRDGVY
jgi:hypothetical protein